MSTDKRLVRVTGFFPTRELLTKAILRLSSTATVKEISKETGVSPATVSRILNGDAPTYTGAAEEEDRVAIRSALLNRHWIIPPSSLETNHAHDSTGHSSD